MATLNSLYSGLQAKMSAELSFSQLMDHPVDKGDNSEESWRKWLSKYLPNRYKIDKATLIDSDGNVSEQIEAVVYDAQYSYLAFNENDRLYLPVESVYAVFEIKQKMNKDYLEYAADKAMSVRNLLRTSAPIPHAGGVYPAKPLLPIISGILTTGCDWNPAFGDPFKKCLQSCVDKRQIDCGCVISEGSFFVDHENSQLNLSAKEESLVSFFLQLLMELQKMGTVPAIELSAYAKSLKKQVVKI